MKDYTLDLTPGVHKDPRLNQVVDVINKRFTVEKTIRWHSGRGIIVVFLCALMTFGPFAALGLVTSEVVGVSLAGLGAISGLLTVLAWCCDMFETGSRLVSITPKQSLRFGDPTYAGFEHITNLDEVPDFLPTFLGYLAADKARSKAKEEILLRRLGVQPPVRQIAPTQGAVSLAEAFARKTISKHPSLLEQRLDVDLDLESDKDLNPLSLTAEDYRLYQQANEEVAMVT